MAHTYANPVVGDHGARQDRFCKDQSATHSQRKRPAQAIRAELYGSNIATITAGTSTDITAKGATPVLILCRQLLAQGVDPDQALEVFRGATLALHVKSIGEAAQLQIGSDGVGFKPARRPGAASPMRKNGGGL